METVGGSVQLMLFIYALAAIISLATAWVIKLIFVVIQRQNRTTSTASADAPAKRTS
jgi:cytoskeletal protein RodZ